jgi:hypothetical protein
MKVQITSLLALSILLGCALVDESTANSNKTPLQVDKTQAYEICLAESKAYNPRKEALENEKSPPFNPDFTPNDNALIAGGGFGGGIARAQQIKKNQDAREKILADCLNKLGKSK